MDGASTELELWSQTSDGAVDSRDDLKSLRPASNTRGIVDNHSPLSPVALMLPHDNQHDALNDYPPDTKVRKPDSYRDIQSSASGKNDKVLYPVDHGWPPQQLKLGQSAGRQSMAISCTNCRRRKVRAQFFFYLYTVQEQGKGRRSSPPSVSS
jgi:hypothetical protein